METVHFQGQIHSEMQNWGQPVVFYRVPVARKSADVKSPLKKRRAKVMEKVCRQMTGGDEETEVNCMQRCTKGCQQLTKTNFFI